MRLVRITSIDQIKTGVRVVYKRQTVSGTIRDAKIYSPRSKRNQYFFLCQNRDNGTTCRKRNRQGYRYSWYVDISTDSSTCLVTWLRNVCGIVGLSIVEDVT